MPVPTFTQQTPTTNSVDSWRTKQDQVPALRFQLRQLTNTQDFEGSEEEGGPHQHTHLHFHPNTWVPREGEWNHLDELKNSSYLLKTRQEQRQTNRSFPLKISLSTMGEEGAAGPVPGGQPFMSKRWHRFPE